MWCVWETGEVDTEFQWGDLSERDHLEDLGMDGRILKWIFNEQDGGMDWVDLSKGRDRWSALVNEVLRFWGP